MNAVPSPLVEILARGDIWRGDALAELLATRAGIGEMSLLLPALARLSADGDWLAGLGAAVLATLPPGLRRRRPAFGAPGRLVPASRLPIICR